MFEFLGYFFAAWCGLSCLILAALCWRASRRKPHPTPEVVNRIETLPPVPLPNTWSYADDVMFAWFAEGTAR